MLVSANLQRTEISDECRFAAGDEDSESNGSIRNRPPLHQEVIKLPHARYFLRHSLAWRSQPSMG